MGLSVWEKIYIYISIYTSIIVLWAQWNVALTKKTVLSLLIRQKCTKNISFHLVSKYLYYGNNYKWKHRYVWNVQAMVLDVNLTYLSKHSFNKN